MQLLEHRVGGRGPGEGFAVGVVRGDEVVDLLDQILDRGERAAADRLVSDQPEEAFDLIQPGTVGLKCMFHLGLAASQARTLGCEWVA